jgi:fumarylacetoacetase
VAADAAAACAATTLNAYMALGQTAWSQLRQALSRALRAGSSAQAMLRSCLVPQLQVEYALPASIGDYTDFYTSIYHATNIGRLFRPDNPLLPNYRWLPIGYHGRASSIVVSGRQIRRPAGQIMPPGAGEPVVAPSRRLDYELELGLFIGTGNPLGTPIPIADAEAHVFGVCLLNDWSARDIQAWEYQPLGPFLSKSFATTISPWIVSLEALAPYRVEWTRAAGEPRPLAYLDCASLRREGAFDIQLEVLLDTARMRAEGLAPQRLCATSYRHAYWSISQLVAHHTINGCNLRSGDLLGTGTLSGPTATEAGALIELTEGGKLPLQLSNEESRTFLEDGDTVILRGWCERPGAARIGFGDATGRLISSGN